MREISKDMKINLFVISIAFLGFAFVYLVITDFYKELIEWPYDDPYYFRAFGIILLVLGIFLRHFFKIQVHLDALFNSIRHT